MAAARKGVTAVGLFKQAWNEIPEVVGGTFMALIGVGMSTAACIMYYQKGMDNKQIKNHYTVYRPDDPRVKSIIPPPPEK